MRLDAREDVGFVSTQPEQLGRGESRKRPVAGEGDQPVEADELLDLGALGARALVVPEDGRAENAVIRVETDQTVHLSREADPGVAGAKASQCLLARVHPVVGILLRPAGVRCHERIALLRRGHDVAVRCDGDRLHAGRADVQADENAHGSTCLVGAFVTRRRARHRRSRRRAPRPCEIGPRATRRRRSARRPSR